MGVGPYPDGLPLLGKKRRAKISLDTRELESVDSASCLNIARAGIAMVATRPLIRGQQVSPAIGTEQRMFADVLGFP